MVSTPIGNLGDMTFRAVDILRRVDRIACEDTRLTGKLLRHFSLSTPMRSYNDHNGAKVRPGLLKDLQDGKSIALVSDAGTPLVSDPGFKLVQACIEQGIDVIPIPGASAVLAGLVVAGLPTDKVLFSGFLPAKHKARLKALRDLSAIDATLVFYESGPRLQAALLDMADSLGPRQAAVGRELTKLHESISRGRLDELAEMFDGKPPIKGELVVIVGPPEGKGATTAVDAEKALRQALKTKSVKDAAAEVAEVTGKSRRALYAQALALTEKSRS